MKNKMKKFGLIGGTSWRSTMEYYASINQLINQRNNDNTNPPLRIISLNQKQIHAYQRSDDWDAIAEIFISAALELQVIGVEGIALCANTPHRIFDQLNSAISVPIVHIADAIGTTLRRDGLDTVGLIGTQFTMSQPFIKGKLVAGYKIETLVPQENDQNEIQSLIYKQLSMGLFENNTKKYFYEVIQSLAAGGAQAVILGCTEFPLLLKDVDCSIPLIDSLTCHCEAIVRYILDDDELDL